MVCVKIIVKSVFDRGADRKLYLRVNSLYSLSKNVGSSVPEGLLAVLGIKGAYLKGAVLFNGSAQVAYNAVQLYAAGSLVQSHADALDYFSSGNSALGFSYGAVF